MPSPFEIVPAGRSLAIALEHQFSPRARSRGEAYAATDRVDAAIDGRGLVCGTVKGSRREPYDICIAPSRELPRVLLAACSCPAGDFELCKHLWAAIRLIDDSRSWPADIPVPTEIELTDLEDPALDPDERDDPPDDPREIRAAAEAEIQLRRASRTTPRVQSWRERLDPFPRPPSPPRKLLAIEYVVDAPRLATRGHDLAPASADGEACVVRFTTTSRTKAGALKRNYGRIDRGRLAPEDRAIHDILCGIHAIVEYSYYGFTEYASGRDASAVRIDAARVLDVLPRLAATGRLGWVPDERTAQLAPLAWDGERAWSLALRLAPLEAERDDTVAVAAALVRGDERIELEALRSLLGAGLAIAGDRIIRIETRYFARWWRLLAGGLEIRASEIADLLTATYRHPAGLVLDLDAVGWSVVDDELVRRIVLEPRERSGFVARAELRYGDRAVAADGHGVTIDPRERRVIRRRPADERAALAALRGIGGALARPWNVPGPRLRDLVDNAAGNGWEVWYDGARIRAGGVVSARVRSGVDWFDLTLDIGEQGATAALPDLLSALRRGRPWIRLSDGTSALVPGWLAARAAMLTDAQVVDGAVRFAPSDATMIAALLDRTAEAQVDAAFVRLRDRLEHFTGLAPRAAPRGFGATLRDYQREGLGWLWFLRELGLGGCLADDMGLGKTVQVLALLDELRRRRSGRKPSLVVAPRSLVFHWIDEARRFAPGLAMVEWHGSMRTERAGELATADVVVTTYATLRIDIERLAAIDFDLIVLDEAQAVKTAATATARATRLLRGEQRLALTGTPVENRLDDLASIFEFLNPGMLGRPAALRAVGAVDAGAGDAADDVEQARALGKVLRPFLLRRTKQEVLTELPPKTELVIGCTLEGSERERYDELRLHYRRALLPAVDKAGVGRHAIAVLEALLRLRQAALHPGLLDARRTGDDSAKLDALVEHLGEALGSGHRALVFSQFTSLLAIVRARLDRERIAYEYLDGQTRDRRERVAAFQGGAASVFLLSLKAGGAGLNLTAADHVFLLDPWWNPAVEAQAIDRVHRIGQGRPVTAYRLVAEDTVEQKILALQTHKRALFDGVFEDKGVVSKLTAADLRALLD